MVRNTPKSAQLPHLQRTHTSAQIADRTAATRRLTLFYIASLTAIAGLSIIGQYLIQQALSQQELDIQVISAAQQQQMLIPQMTKTALILQRTTDSDERQQYQLELEELIESAELGQEKMTTLATELRLSMARRQQIQHMMAQLTPLYQQIVTSVRQSGTANPTYTPTSASSLPNARSMPGNNMPNPTAPPPNAPPSSTYPVNARPMPGNPSAPPPPPGTQGEGRGGLPDAERTFMQTIDQLTLTYNQQVAASVQYLKSLELFLLIVTLIVLVLEGVLVFRPAVENIHTSLYALTQSLQETQETAKRLTKEQQKSEKLLLNILPKPVAHRLKQKQQAIADGFAEVTVLFADIVGFTQLSETMPPQNLVQLLNQIFSAFDQLAEHYGLEKIKTIGDAYMVVGGLPVPRADHAEAIVAMALGMQKVIAHLNTQIDESLSIRIGVNTGPVVAGVIGIKKFIYDLWGDTVNTASRMESHGIPGGIQITESTYQLIKHKYTIQPQGKVQIKGKGEMETYLVTGMITE